MKVFRKVLILVAAAVVLTGCRAGATQTQVQVGEPPVGTEAALRPTLAPVVTGKRNGPTSASNRDPRVRS